MVLSALMIFSLFYLEKKTSYFNYISFSKVTANNATSTSTDYSWVGNSWVPPPGVPHLSPQDLRVLFQSENMLWWGDSSARQDYHTMYSMINADDVYNIDRQELDRDINKGKGKRPPEQTFHCPNRSPQDNMFFDLGQVIGTNCSNCSSSIGKFDLAFGKRYSDVLSEFIV